MKQKRLLGNRRFRPWPFLFLLVAGAMLVYLFVGTFSVSKALLKEQLDQQIVAIRRHVVTCYALEGRYPDSIDYLEEEYSLSLDRERYVYHYQNLGVNIFPQIAVFSLDPAQ